MRLDDTQEIAVREHGLGALALEEALRTLPEPLAHAFVLVKCEQLCYREAAEVLGIPQGTIQFRVHEASQRLRKALQEVMPETSPEPVRGCM